MSALPEFSQALADTVTQASSGVVRVEARRRLPATGIIWSADGLIMTAHHVVKHDSNILIGLPDGASVPAELVGRDPATDTAVLRADASDLTPFVESDKKTLGVGHLTLALGRPGKTVQATLGIISALGDGWRTPWGGQIDRYLQTDVVMYPGFSGGPLVDANGRLIGLNTSGLSRGVSLAVPTPTLARVADSLLAHGRMRRGYLGIHTQRVRLPESLQETLGQKTGLLIISVEADSPAAQGGLTMGDTIVNLAMTPVRHHEDLLAQLSGDRVETAVPIKIIRGGQLQKVQVVVGERT
jgi:S1-C subfamily serine protease